MSTTFDFDADGAPTYREQQRMLTWAREKLAEKPENVRFTTLNFDSPVDGHNRRVVGALRTNGDAVDVAFAVARPDEQFMRDFGRAQALERLETNDFVTVQFPKNTVYSVTSPDGKTQSISPLPFKDRDVLYQVAREYVVNRWKSALRQKAAEAAQLHNEDES